MKIAAISLLLVLFLIAPIFAIDGKEPAMGKIAELSQRQQGIIPIAAFTADGDIDRLTVALNQGLDDGLSVNEIKEVLVHIALQPI